MYYIYLYNFVIVVLYIIDVFNHTAMCIAYYKSKFKYLDGKAMIGDGQTMPNHACPLLAMPILVHSTVAIPLMFITSLFFYSGIVLMQQLYK